MQCFVLMWKVVSQCAGLLHTKIVYERHSGALLDKAEVLEIPAVAEMVKTGVEKKCCPRTVADGVLDNRGRCETVGRSNRE